jgi:aryl-alcohol dehydrogenase-like predicted oxidoreductase
MLKTLSGKPLSKLSLGGAALGSCKDKVFFGKTISDVQAIETVLEALNNGINLIDTSPFYGDSERKIGMALLEYGNRESVLISTKAGTHPSIKGYSADIIKRSIDNSLKQLQVSYLDIVHIHDPGIDDFDKLMEDGGGIETLTELRYQGVIRNIGLGVRDHKLHSKFINSGFADVILP